MDWNDDNEHLMVVRKTNRVLRRVNQALRSANKTNKEYSDALFLELCEVDKEAELAMEKLWTLGNFSCDPRDYNTIVETCLKALSQTQQTVAEKLE